MKGIKKGVKAALCVLLALVIALSGYLAYVLAAYYRVEDSQECEILFNASVSAMPETGKRYRITSCNIGFGAYSADYSFFMDGGKESRARSADAVVSNTTGSLEAVGSCAPDFALFQEVDVDGTRSHHVDQLSVIASCVSASMFPAYNAVFAQNYDSPYLFYPFTEPHGANRSGIATFTGFRIDSAVRRQLPIETGLMKLVDLDRCYSVSRIPVEGGKELVLYNLHLSAYTSDGAVAIRQLELLLGDMKSEYEAGNYCVAGGDFNKDLPGNSGDLFGVPANESDAWAQPIPDGTIPEGLRLVVPLHEDAPVASCRTASEPYDIATSFRITVDGFVVSDNVTVLDSNVIDTQFQYSDHNPVYMDFLLD